MMMRALLIAIVLVPQMATAADLSRARRHHGSVHPHPHRYATAPNVLIRCTTTDLGLFTSSDCGQGFDPLAAAAGR